MQISRTRNANEHAEKQDPHTQLAGTCNDCVQLYLCDHKDPTRLPCPWNSPDQNGGVGCHFLLQGSNLRLLHLLHQQADSFITGPSKMTGDLSKGIRHQVTVHVFGMLACFQGLSSWPAGATTLTFL